MLEVSPPCQAGLNRLLGRKTTSMNGFVFGSETFYRTITIDDLRKVVRPRGEVMDAAGSGESQAAGKFDSSALT